MSRDSWGQHWNSSTVGVFVYNSAGLGIYVLCSWSAVKWGEYIYACTHRKPVKVGSIRAASPNNFDAICKLVRRIILYVYRNTLAVWYSLLCGKYTPSILCDATVPLLSRLKVLSDQRCPLKKMMYYFTYSTVDQCTVDTDYAEVATPYIVYVSLGSVGPYILSTELILLEQYSVFKKSAILC